MPQPDRAITLDSDETKQPRPDIHPAPIPDPEPASPSLDEPDPAVFHHTPTRPPD